MQQPSTETMVSTEITEMTEPVTASDTGAVGIVTDMTAPDTEVIADAVTSTVLTEPTVRTEPVTQTQPTIQTEPQTQTEPTIVTTSVSSASAVSPMKEISSAAGQVTEETSAESSAESEVTDTSEMITTEATLATTAEQTAVTTVAVSAPKQSVTVSPSMIGLVFLIIVLAAAMVLAPKFMKGMGKKKKTSDENSTPTAKDIDRERLAALEPKKKKKEKNVKDKKNFAKTVLDTIPYKKVIADDIFYLGDKMYSKAYAFDDVNFNLADEDYQYLYLERYMKFLNILDDTIDCQICLWNSRIDINDFKKRSLIKQSADSYFDLRFEYNGVLENNISKGQNAIQKRMYVTLTVKAPDDETAIRRFASLDIAAINTFNLIGDTNMRVLTSQERIELLKNFFVGDDGFYLPEFTEEDYKQGTEKLYCCPDYFEFKKDYFMYGNTYAKTIYLKEIPAIASSDIFNRLLETGLDLMVTTNIETFDSGEARKLVQRQITAVDTDMAKRETQAAQHGNFSSQMPQKIKNERDSMVNVFDKITNQDMKLFYINIQILIKASTFEELNNNLDIVESVLKRSSCVKGEMPWDQESGLTDILPCGYQRKFQYQRAVPSDGVAIFMPFNVKEMQMENSTYYGLNVESNNMIMFNRMTGLQNPAGFFLGAPGGGKSMAAKREMVDTFLRYSDADIIVIDPEREYGALTQAFDGQVIRFSTGSTNYINIFDFDFRFLDEPTDDNDERVDIIADKCQLVTSFISCMDPKNPLTIQEKAFVDRNVRRAYEKSGVLISRDPADMPTFETFLECMKGDTENVHEDIRNKLILTIDMYVNGSAKYFSNQTNVNTDNRFVSYDIRDLNGNLKTQSMLLILDYVWNRLSRNRDMGRKTFIYFDEAHLLFADEYCLDFLKALWKRARKYGGVLTGITQNVEDLLKDEKSRSMLANSEFLLLLKQNPTDAAKLQDILHFTDSEIRYVNDTPPGHGILVLGIKTKIPFYDEFPRSTKLYTMMTTNFNETAKMIAEKAS